MLPHSALLPGDIAGHKYQTWCVTIDTKRTSVSDLFRPQYWIACTRLRSNDIIRCMANDGTYDFFLKVTSHKIVGHGNQTAVTVSMFPQVSPAVLAAAEGDVASEMVPTVLHGKPVPRIEVIASGKWRLIGFDGQIVGDLLPNEAAAEGAYDEYIAAHGITHELDQPPVDARTGQTAIAAPVAAPSPTQVTPSDRPGQFSYAKKKEIAKREAKMAKRRELDDRNKARTAERLAAAASDAA
jgi:hypothetical protein